MQDNFIEVLSFIVEKFEIHHVTETLIIICKTKIQIVILYQLKFQKLYNM